ncbi:carnitine O-acetyltransferase [Malassezia cuniculi]|uniref:Carnitine O-acetyltransferase n=1 Tax=Malassezia cuniculi TaxID=948313 RepID=A0AAF0EWF4_9BASI|nr:carnitine O-acetyltransferase [Malassezia cuniculi]
MEKGVTFSHQSELRKLPVPSLEDTCRRYLRSLEALQTPEEHARTTEIVNKFLAEEGPKLQADLVEYDKTHESYVEEFWEDSYLNGNESVVLNLNPFFILEDEPDKHRGSQLMRAANLTIASLSFIHDLRHEVLDPDLVRGVPLDMFQYKRLFGMARIPMVNGCRQEIDQLSRHIIVLRRGQFYWFDVLDEEHRPLLTERAMVATLKAIMRDADTLSADQVARGAVGVLSTEQRRTWYHLRSALEIDPQNHAFLRIIDSALFVLCLDDTVPQNASELTKNMLCGTYSIQDDVQVGTCLNRWYDKLQIIVCANGAAGVNFEHSSVDGHTVLRYVADIYTELILQFAKSINSSTKSLFQAKPSPDARGQDSKKPIKPRQEVVARTLPKKLEWVLSDEIVQGIRYAEMRLSDLTCQNESHVLHFNGYGKRFITRHGFSPDAFVQMAFQAAYYSLYGRLASTYEPAMTKAFTRGRTETIRTVQPHVLAFVRAWTSTKSSAHDRLNALRAACMGHAKISKECATGQGFDRHMYALLSLWQKHNADNPDAKTPEIFRDQGFKQLNHVVLSTSNCGNPALRIFGFGPVVQDGFGIGYIIQNDRLTVCASSKHLQTKRFLATLEKYLYMVQNDIISVFRAANEFAKSTYVDHAGNECDARTGLPIGIPHMTKAADASQAGTSGYSFYGDGNESYTHVLSSMSLKNVGKLLYVNDYE